MAGTASNLGEYEGLGKGRGPSFSSLIPSFRYEL